MIGLAMSAGIMLVRSRAAADARRAAMARAGQPPVSALPGPLVFLLVFVVTLAIFLMAKAFADQPFDPANLDPT